MKNVTIYTDGACSGNPGPGGWGAVLIYGDVRKEISGSEENTTNNRMELTAAIEALSILKQPCEVKLCSDSTYLIHAHTQGWIASWIRNDWKKSDKGPVENEDLWRRLVDLGIRHRVTWQKVKGHADDELNNRCDALATGAIKAMRENKQVLG